MAGACNALCNGCGPKKRDERMRENLLCVSQNVWKTFLGQRCIEGENWKAVVMQRLAQSGSRLCQQQSGQIVAKNDQTKLEQNFRDTNTWR